MNDGNLFYSISKSPNLKKFFSHPFQTTLMHVSYFYCFLNLFFHFFIFYFFCQSGIDLDFFLSINCIKLIVPMVLHMKTNKITHGNQKCTFKTIYAKIFVFVYKRCNQNIVLLEMQSKYCFVRFYVLQWVY